ncbi:MAG: peroxiredoxin family protein [candidate division Zixibacteria bacterium]
MFNIGDKAPYFNLDGSRDSAFRLAALEGERKKFEKLNTEILGINPASVKSHENYCDKKGFEFTILSDPDKKIAKKYDSLNTGGMLIRRSVYVIESVGKIIFAEKGMPENQKMMDAIMVVS